MSVYPGQFFNFSHHGREFRAAIEQDDMGAPWKESDGNLNVTRVNHDYKKRPSEVFLYKGNSREWSYIYDLRDEIDTAMRDGWGPRIDGETKRQTAVRAVQENAKFLRGWCAGEWCYVYVGVTMIDADGEDMSETEWLGGCESFCDYVEKEVVFELAEQCTENAVHVIGG